MTTTVAVPGGRLAVWERGAGPPLVLVHSGTSTAHHDWGGLAPALARDHRVVMHDQRGHGDSVAPGGEPTLRRCAADLPHVLGRLGIPTAWFVGLSMGANAVLHLLVRRPELARGAVLVGGSATGDPRRIRAMAAAGAWPTSLRRLRHAGHPDRAHGEHLRRVLLEDWAMNTELRTDDLARVRCPVLVVHGREDTVQPIDVGRHLAGALPAARLVEVPGAGHVVPRDRSAVFLGLVRSFVASTRAAT